MVVVIVGTGPTGVHCSRCLTSWPVTVVDLAPPATTSELVAATVGLLTADHPQTPDSTWAEDMTALGWLGMQQVDRLISMRWALAAATMTTDQEKLRAVLEAWSLSAAAMDVP
jgi:hypothetical protein